MSVPCISLWQPFASLCFVEDIGSRKVHETRPRRFPEKYRGQRIAIQAAAAFAPPKVISAFHGLHALCCDVFSPDYRYTLSCGAVLGTVLFMGSAPAEEAEPHSWADRVAGDWAPGRYVMRLDDPQPLATPLPWKGSQGWFSVDLFGAGSPTPATGEMRRDG